MNTNNSLIGHRFLAALFLLLTALSVQNSRAGGGCNVNPITVPTRGPCTLVYPTTTISPTGSVTSFGFNTIIHNGDFTAALVNQGSVTAAATQAVINQNTMFSIRNSGMIDADTRLPTLASSERSPTPTLGLSPAVSADMR